MTVKDSLQRFIFEQMPVRGEYIQLVDSYQTIVDQHAYPPPIRKLLGEALCVAGLLSAIIKFDGRLTVQFRGTSALKLLLAQSDNEFHLRGLVKWEGELSYEELMQSMNDGVLIITLDMGENKNRYQGIVSWRGNSLRESIEGYFRDSEQLATRLWLAIDDKQAAGFLMQIIPGASKDEASSSEEDIKTHWDYVNNQAKGLSENLLLNTEFSTLIQTIFPHDDVRVFKPVPVSFKCTCSRKNGADAIRILGQKEAEEELKDHNTIVVTCDFCNKEYIFDRDDVKHIFENTKRDSELH